MIAYILHLLVPIAHAESAGGSVTQTLGLDWGRFIASLVNFGIVVFILWKWVFTPLTNIMQKRAETIEKSVQHAKEVEALRREAAEFHAHEMEKARKQATEIIAQAEAAANRAKDQIATEAKQQADKILRQGEKLLAEERQKMIAEAREELATMVVAATERLIKEKLDPKKDEQIIKDSLKNL